MQQTSSGVTDSAEQFARSVAPLRAVMLRLARTLNPPQQAEDVVQDALARAWTKRDQFSPERGSFEAWVLAVLANIAKGRWRRLEPVLPLDLGAVVAQRDHDASLDIRRAVNSLPPRQRSAVVLFYYVDLSVLDIAEILGTSPGTVKSALHDGRRSLAERLGVTYERH
jgi:RNA polymerase sigma factor (sigma-70 family)